MKKGYLLLVLFCMSCSANIVLDKRNQNHVVRDENGIIAKYLSDSLVLYVNREGKDISAIPNMVYFDKGEEGLIRELFSSLDYSNEEYGGKVVFFILFNDMLQVQEVRVYEPLYPSYKANNFVIKSYVKYLEQTEGRWLRRGKKQNWYLYVFSTII